MDFCLTEPVSTTSEVYLDEAALEQPEPHTTYHVRLAVLAATSDQLGGVRARIDPGGAIGGCLAATRGGSAAGLALYAGMALDASSASVLGLTSAVNAGSTQGWTPAVYECWLATGAVPGPIRGVLGSELPLGATTTALEGATCLDVLDSAPVSLPVPDPAGPSTLLLIGHSGIQGNGSDPTYGGSSIPAWLTLVRDGALLTAWPAAPTIAPYLAEHLDPMVDATVVTRASGGASLATISGVHWPAAVSDWSALAAAPELVVAWAGEGNCSTAALRDAFVAGFDPWLDSIHATYPDARVAVVQVHPIGCVYGADLVAAQAAACASDDRRVCVDPRTPTFAPIQADKVHALPGRFGGNDMIADRVASAW